MAERPELIAFSQYCLGGVFSFYENLLSFQDGVFEKKIVLLNATDQNDPAPSIKYAPGTFTIFDFKYAEQPADSAKRLQNLISDKPGIVLTNFSPELASLHLFRKKNKTIYYICHDEQYVETAIKYSFLIDVFIAHNPAMFSMLTKGIPKRYKDIFYLPYGIVLSKFQHLPRDGKVLKLTFLARHVLSKGILDIPKINQLLIEQGVNVFWTIFGDGRDTQLFRDQLAKFDNIVFKKYETKEELYINLKEQDLMIHPSSMDGLPVALLEAMSAGVVPIMYEFNSGLRQLFPENTAVILPVGDYVAMASQIASFDDNRALLKNYSSNAVELINREFEINKQSEAYYQLFFQFENKKKPFQRKFLKYYHGWGEHPLVPKLFSKLFRKIKRNVYRYYL